MGLPASALAVKGQARLIPVPARAAAPEMAGTLDIRLHPEEGKLSPPAELLLQDPQGRWIGYDPRRLQNYQGIPRASYDMESLEDEETGAPGPETAIINLPNALSGNYILRVIATERGKYTLEVRAYDRDLSVTEMQFAGMATKRGAVNYYLIRFSHRQGTVTRLEVRPTRPWEE
jgi:hypothetical protein